MVQKVSSIIIVLLVVAASAANATTFIVPSDDQLADKAQAIVIGTVIATHSGFSPENVVMTSTEIRVDEVIKGDFAAGQLVKSEAPGGVVGNIARAVHGSPSFQPGKRVLVFLVEWKPGRWGTVDLAVGKFDFERDVRGREVLVREEGEIAGWDSNLKPYIPMRRSAPDFVRFLRERKNGQGVKNYEIDAAPLQATTSTTTSLPTEANAIVLPATNYLMQQGGSNFRWRVWDSSPGTQIAWRSYNGAAVPGSDTAMTSGTAAWTNDAGSSINIYYAGVTTKNPPQGVYGNADGENTVSWEMTLPGIAAFSCGVNGYSGVLGVGGPMAWQNTTHTFDGMQYYGLTEGDVNMNRGLGACSLLPQRSKNAVIVHEIGHALNFRHSDKTRDGNSVCTDPLPCSSTAIMTSSLPSGLDAVLQPYDIDAARAVYPGAAAPPPPPPPTGSGVKGDFNGDSRADLIWRNRVTGANNFWFLSGGAVVGGGSTNPVNDPSWTIGGTADFNRDGHSDIVWRNITTGANTVWFMNGPNYVSQTALASQTDTNWRISGAGDLNADGHSDIVWRNIVTGANAVWFMNGAVMSSAANLPAVTDLNWQIAGAGDTNADGRADIILWHRTAGSVVVWFMNGATRTSQAFIGTVADINWRVAGVGDFNGDARADIEWKHVAGDTALWTLNGAAVTGGGFVGAVSDTNWDIAGAR